MFTFKRNSNSFLRTLFLTLALITTISLSNAQTVYRYDWSTGLWKRVDRGDAVVNFLTQPLQSLSSAASTAIPLQGTIAVEPTSILETKLTSPPATKNRWYFYMHYTVTNSSQEHSYRILAGQSIDAGTATIWNDATKIYVRFELNNDWLADESHLNFVQSEPDEFYSPVPGQFPFKLNHSSSVAAYTYEILFSDIQNKCGFLPQPGDSVYVLLHLKIKNNRGQSETAWAGPETSCFSVSVSATKLAWFLRKPGDYATKAIDVSVISEYPVVVTFKDFNDPVNEAGNHVQTYFSFETLENWIKASDLSTSFRILEPGNSTFGMYHRVVLQGQPACNYFSVGTISFAIVMVKSKFIK